MARVGDFGVQQLDVSASTRTTTTAVEILRALSCATSTRVCGFYLNRLRLRARPSRGRGGH